MRGKHWESNENIPNNDGVSAMSDIADDLRKLSEPWIGGEPVKVAIDRAAKRAGLSYWRTYDLWYRRPKRIENYEREQVAAALAEKKRLETRNEVRDLRMRLEILEARLAQVDADFHREEIGAIRGQVRGLR
jgi:hypothetical protein